MSPVGRQPFTLSKALPSTYLTLPHLRRLSLLEFGGGIGFCLAGGRSWRCRRTLSVQPRRQIAIYYPANI